MIKALNTAIESGEEISISAIARNAAVDRTFLYRHPDLHALVMTKAAEPPYSPTTGPAVSRASLIADLAGAHNRINRLVRENAQLRDRLSEALGEQAWRESRLGGPTTSRISATATPNSNSKSWNCAANSAKRMTTSMPPA